MPRKKKPAAGTDELAAGFALAAAAMRPMIEQIVDERIVKLMGEWVAKNARNKVVGPDDISRLGPNGAPKREG